MRLFLGYIFITLSISGCGGDNADPTPAPVDQDPAPIYVVPTHLTSTAINEAIELVSIAGGGTVFLPAGTYEITESVVLKNNVQLMGDGHGTLLKLVTPVTASPLFPIITNAEHTLGNTDMTVRNLSMEGSLTDGSHAIRFERVKRVVVENVRVQYANGDGIHFDNGVNKLTNATPGNGEPLNEDIVIQNNDISDTNSDGITGVFKNVRIIGNRVTRPSLASSDGQHGIHLHTSGISEGAVIAGNIINDAQTCINVTNANNVVVANNQGTLCKEHGILIDIQDLVPTMGNIAITGNVIRNTTKDGIRVYTTVMRPARNFSISGNTFQEIGASAISISAAEAGVITGNTMSNINGANAIYILASMDIAISGNMIRDTGGTGSGDAGIRFEACTTSAAAMACEPPVDTQINSARISVMGNTVTDTRNPSTLERGFYVGNNQADAFYVSGNVFSSTYNSAFKGTGSSYCGGIGNPYCVGNQENHP